VTKTERRVLSRWQVRYFAPTETVVERWGGVLSRTRVGAFVREHVFHGASETRVVREGGASEQVRIGASERRWQGASERVKSGASEMMAWAASQWRKAGASEHRFTGASERMGASERSQPMGSSEKVFNLPPPNGSNGGPNNGKKG
jgi:hypothetical protein